MTVKVALESYGIKQQLMNDELNFKGELTLKIKTCGTDIREQEKAKDQMIKKVHKMCADITKDLAVL